MSKITYDDKVDLHVDSNIADINKVSASDMNEIKSAVNDNDDSLGDISTLTTTDKTSVVNAVNELNTGVNELDAPEKWVAVGIEEPTDGRRVFFAHSKNVLKHSAYDRTLNGVTLKVNEDKSITLTGTASANTNFNIGTNSTIKLKAGTYTFTKGATNVQLLIYYSSASVLGNLPIGASSQTITINSDTTYENYRVVISIPSGTQTNETIYPMLRLSSTSNTYEPYVEPSINVDEELLYQQPTILYQGSGSTTGTITLNDSVANYSCIDVVFSIDSFSENVRNYIRMEKYNTTQIFGNLISGQVDGSGNLRVWATRITISGTTATLDRDICLSLNTSGISSQTSRIKVVKVIGYK